MPSDWSKFAPMLAIAADTALAVVALALLGRIASPLLMRASHARPKTRDFGCFLYSAGLWVLVRCLIGGLGAVLGVIIYLWEKGKDIDAIKKSTDELQKKVSVGWLLMFICAIGFLGLVGERLRKISEKHHEIARAGFRKLFGSRVPSALPVGLKNGSDVVLAYRAVWEECFNVPGAKNIDGWKLGDLCERVRLIYFSPSVGAIQPSTETAGAAVNVTGTGFTEAQAVHFGPVQASSMHVNSDTQITVTIPAGRGTVPLRVTSRAGVTSTPSSTSIFIYATQLGPPHPP
jgi:hypothetical protein